MNHSVQNCLLVSHMGFHFLCSINDGLWNCPKIPARKGLVTVANIVPWEAPAEILWPVLKADVPLLSTGHYAWAF